MTKEEFNSTSYAPGIKIKNIDNGKIYPITAVCFQNCKFEVEVVLEHKPIKSKHLVWFNCNRFEFVKDKIFNGIQSRRKASISDDYDLINKVVK